MLTTGNARPFGILIIDDEPFILDLLARMIRPYGLTVFTAINGREARRLLCDHLHEIDGVILDRHLGYECSWTVRSLLQELKPSLIFCQMTAGPLWECDLPAGFAYVLLKPFQLRDLEACLSAICYEREIEVLLNHCPDFAQGSVE